MKEFVAVITIEKSDLEKWLYSGEEEVKGKLRLAVKVLFDRMCADTYAYLIMRSGGEIILKAIPQGKKKGGEVNDRP